MAQHTAASSAAPTTQERERGLLSLVEEGAVQTTLPSSVVNTEALRVRARCKACALMTR
jgi:hypothetical protein